MHITKLSVNGIHTGWAILFSGFGWNLLEFHIGYGYTNPPTGSKLYWGWIGNREAALKRSAE